MKSLHLPLAYPEYMQSLRIDCSLCNGFCCVALYFSKMDGFPEDKKEGIPCSHLQRQFACDIYACLKDRNLTGCLHYDCFGAGQFVSTKLFPMVTWQNAKEPSMLFSLFQIVYRMQEMLWYLLEASTLFQDARIALKVQEYEAFTQLEPQAMMNFHVDHYQSEVNEILKDTCSSIGCFHPSANRMLLGKDLRKQETTFCDFSMALLIGVDARGCTFYGSNFLGADVRNMNVMHADLRESIFLTQRQVNSMMGNATTKLPKYIERPQHWEEI